MVLMHEFFELFSLFVVELFTEPTLTLVFLAFCHYLVIALTHDH